MTYHIYIGKLMGLCKLQILVHNMTYHIYIGKLNIQIHFSLLIENYLLLYLIQDRHEILVVLANLKNCGTFV